MGEYMRYVRNKRRGEKFDVYVGRGTPFGNPFKIGRDGDRAAVIRKFRAHLYARPDLVAKVKRELRGKTLGCWCAPEACHAEILAECANE